MSTPSATKTPGLSTPLPNVMRPERGRIQASMIVLVIFLIGLVGPTKFFVQATVMQRTTAGFVVAAAMGLLALGLLVTIRHSVKAHGLLSKLMVLIFGGSMLMFMALTGGFQWLRFVPGEDSKVTGKVTSVAEAVRSQRVDCVLSVQLFANWALEGDVGTNAEPVQTLLANEPNCSVYRAQPDSVVTATVRKNPFGEFLLPLT